jgi:tetratricopeptide (TPR) repeat protein
MASDVERTGSKLWSEPLELVGREAELRLLDSALERAIEYLSPQMVHIQGDVGVGKSRLVEGWLAQLEKRPQEVRAFRGAAEVGDGDCELFGRLLRRRFTIAEHTAPDEAKQQMRDACQEVFEDRRMAEILHFLGSFMGLRFRDNPFLHLLEEDPLEHEHIARTVLRRFFEADSHRSPVVLIFEDLQYADDPSLDLIKELGEGFEGAHLVLVAVSQPKLRVRRPGWGVAEGDVTDINVGPLQPADAEQYLRRLLSGVSDLPDGFVSDSVEMTGGNPYFLQQLLRMLVDQRILDTSRELWSIDMARFARAELPMSVEDAIDARIMALTVEERLVLEMASTMGNVFWFGALVVLSRLLIEDEEQVPWKSDEVAERLRVVVDGLVDRDYIMDMPDSWIPREQEYLFKHNLEYSIIEATVDPKRQKRFHLFVAQWLESRIREPSEDHFEFLGAQNEAGGDPRRAAFCFIRAGDLARAKFANELAIRNYENGLRLLETPNVLAKIDALHSIGAVCAHVGRNKEALAHFQEMLRLSWLLDAVSKGGAALGRIGRIHRSLGEYDEAMERYQSAQQLFRRAKDLRGVAGTLDDTGKVHFLQGDYSQALRLHEKALDLRHEIGDERSTAFTLASIGMVYQAVGQFQEALRCFEESLDIRRRIEDFFGVVESLNAAAEIFQELGEYDRARLFWTDALEVARTTGDRLEQARQLIGLGESHRLAGELDRARGMVAEAQDIVTSLGNDRLWSDCLRIRGRIALDAGDMDVGRDLLKEALVLAEERGYDQQVGVTQRALAELAANRGFAHEAEERFEKSMEIFSTLGNHLEVLRCCEAMADFYDQTGGEEKVKQFRESAENIRKRLVEAAQGAPSSE